MRKILVRKTTNAIKSMQLPDNKLKDLLELNCYLTSTVRRLYFDVDHMIDIHTFDKSYGTTVHLAATSYNDGDLSLNEMKSIMVAAAYVKFGFAVCGLKADINTVANTSKGAIENNMFLVKYTNPKIITMACDIVSDVYRMVTSTMSNTGKAIHIHGIAKLYENAPWRFVYDGLISVLENNDGSTHTQVARRIVYSCIDRSLNDSNSREYIDALDFKSVMILIKPDARKICDALLRFNRYQSRYAEKMLQDLHVKMVMEIDDSDFYTYVRDYFGVNKMDSEESDKEDTFDFFR